jgi:hypothetical protein
MTILKDCSGVTIRCNVIQKGKVITIEHMGSSQVYLFDNDEEIELFIELLTKLKNK